MTFYRYEMHCHCSECSACAVSPIRDMVRAYHAAGYAGLVLTDHFIFGNTSVPRSLPWDERMRRYYDAYLAGRDEGNKLDFDVLFGIEHAYGDGKELLTYGIDLNFLLQNPDIPQISIREYAARAHAAGGFVAQAHPFRNRDYINMSVQPIPEILDGAEVYNHANAPGENPRALTFAKAHNLIPVSGADCHNADCDWVGKAGLAFPYRIRDNHTLVQALLAGDGRLIINGKILDSDKEPVMR